MIALNKFLREAKFLIIDDEPANIRLIEMQLEELGRTNFRSTMDPRDAVELYKEFKPDLVFIDIMMPYINGVELIELLRNEIPPDEYIPIVALTADVHFSTRKRALESGARDFLLKPFDADELDLRVRNLLEARFLYLGIHRQNRALVKRFSQQTNDLENAMRELDEAHSRVIQQARLEAFATMASGIVHDFNNSLMVVLGFSEVLLGCGGLDDAEEARRDIERIQCSAKDAAEVVKRLRQFYRPREEGETYGPVSAYDFVQQGVDLAEPRWKVQALGKGVEISVRIDVPKDLGVSGNASELREALLNLIFNAVDAMPEGGDISISATEHGGNVSISIADTGMGMTEEVARRCVEPFFSTKGDRGTGLGLAMVFGIVRRHGGGLDIWSKPGAGSIFTMTLPKCELAPARPRLERDLLASKPMRILFAEDDEDVRRLICHHLEEFGHIVTPVRNGSLALASYVPGAFDIVITDLSMPKLDGCSLARHIKDQTPNVPVILLTGFGDMLLHEQDYAQAPIDLLLSKPITADQLNRSLSHCLNLESAPMYAV